MHRFLIPVDIKIANEYIPEASYLFDDIDIIVSVFKLLTKLKKVSNVLLQYRISNQPPVNHYK
jgi:hypothetical protein